MNTVGRGELGLQLLPASNRPDERWRNGGGSTAEVARRVGVTGEAGEFDWRISMATVAEDGPFSAFPGISRTITVLSGGPLVLRVAGARVDLDAGADPFTFDGGAPTVSELRGEPVTDLNVMVRERAFASRVTWLEPGERRVGELGDFGERGEFGQHGVLRKLADSSLVIVALAVECEIGFALPGGNEFTVRLGRFDAVRVDDVDPSLVVRTVARVDRADSAGQDGKTQAVAIAALLRPER